ncbi:Lysophospholipase L1 [Pseudoxanthomonas sp. CF385]|uniref:SGNH/GDSL hydrolase family protein n=1 Tax=Pseudoxanthomonas sp. CF385 TaxID=1881042 RepID=UPI000885AC3B|nr:SGNH/GDSL hydrolase family protein [Pseudoxanthomonas sp. CF385]SDQ42629.1 Lysophospholipase L1 [Pseudoxanthomonas sp. CF385]
MPFLNAARLPLFSAALAALLVACASSPTTTTPAAAATPAPAKSAPRIPEQVSNPAWEADMQRFEAADAQSPPPRGGVLFIGSSSIRFWDTLAQDFPGVPVINRGFGGSELRDSTWYADRILVPYAPRQILIYAGDNDLNAGRTPQQLHADFIAFVERVRRDLPKAKIAYISNKPSPSRAQLLSVQREANTLIQAEAKRLGVDYIDIFTPMLDATGQPDENLFIEDRLHMNRAGYVIWQRVIAPYVK